MDQLDTRSLETFTGLGIIVECMADGKGHGRLYTGSHVYLGKFVVALRSGAAFDL